MGLVTLLVFCVFVVIGVVAVRPTFAAEPSPPRAIEPSQASGFDVTALQRWSAEFGVPGGVVARKGLLRIEYRIPSSGYLSVRNSFDSANEGFRRFTFHLRDESTPALY